MRRPGQLSITDPSRDTRRSHPTSAERTLIAAYSARLRCCWGSMTGEGSRLVPASEAGEDGTVTRTALITGVGRRRGIGAGLAAGLAADGWDLVLSFWSPYDDRLGLGAGANDPQALADELESHGIQVELAPVDLADPAGPERLIEASLARFGPLDALVMSHCESVDSSLLTTTVESFDRHYAVNVRATWLLLAAFARQLPATGGSVVALTSDHTVNNLPYGATKAALDRLVIAAAHEFGDRGLRANVTQPWTHRHRVDD